LTARSEHDAWTRGGRDNGNPELKAHLRRTYLDEFKAKPRVLDLFCGTGEMYRRVYAGRVREYVGVDRERVHDPALCITVDNRTYVAHNDIGRFDVFDLDDYGCPWALFYRVLEKVAHPTVVVFLTDSLIMRAGINGKAPRMVAAVNGIPKGMVIPALAQRYHDLFRTMLLDVEDRFGYHTARATYARSERSAVYYWALRLERTAGRG
jgi:SAM-dependent methyltransferase